MASRVMTSDDFHKIMSRLAQRRPVFHTEADFQHALATYAFIKDISRVEACGTGGFAVFLTNEKAYWMPQSEWVVIGREFCLSEGCTIASGPHGWEEETGAGTKKGIEEPVTLRWSYKARWRNYSSLPVDNGLFRYLLVEVPESAD